jgi:hypothetical protein
MILNYFVYHVEKSSRKLSLEKSEKNRHTKLAQLNERTVDGQLSNKGMIV